MNKEGMRERAFFAFYDFQSSTFNFQLKKIASSLFFYYLCSEFGELGLLNPEILEPFEFIELF